MSSPLQSSYFFKFLHFSTRFCCFLPAGTANKNVLHELQIRLPDILERFR